MNVLSCRLAAGLLAVASFAACIETQTISDTSNKTDASVSDGGHAGVDGSEPPPRDGGGPRDAVADARGPVDSGGVDAAPDADLVDPVVPVPDPNCPDGTKPCWGVCVADDVPDLRCDCPCEASFCQPLDAPCTAFPVRLRASGGLDRAPFNTDWGDLRANVFLCGRLECAPPVHGTSDVPCGYTASANGRHSVVQCGADGRTEWSLAGSTLVHFVYNACGDPVVSSAHSVEGGLPTRVTLFAYPPGEDASGGRRRRECVASWSDESGQWSLRDERLLTTEGVVGYTQYYQDTPDENDYLHYHVTGTTRLRQSDPRANWREWQYDEQGRLVLYDRGEVENPVFTKWTFEYDDVTGTMTSSSSYEDEDVEYSSSAVGSYDEAGRPLQFQVDGTAEVEDWQYDASHTLLSCGTPDERIDFVYDEAVCRSMAESMVNFELPF